MTIPYQDEPRLLISRWGKIRFWFELYQL